MSESYSIFKAEREDLEEILQLQYLAYQSEAALFGNKDIPPLKETIDEVIEQFDRGIILKMVNEKLRTESSTLKFRKLLVLRKNSGAIKKIQERA